MTWKPTWSTLDHICHQQRYQQDNPFQISVLQTCAALTWGSVGPIPTKAPQPVVKAGSSSPPGAHAGTKPALAYPAEAAHRALQQLLEEVPSIWNPFDPPVITKSSPIIPDRSHYIFTFTASSWESEHAILAAHRLRCRVESWLQMCATIPINRGTSSVQPSTCDPPAPLNSLAGHTACTASDRSVTAGACYPVVF